MMLRRLACLIVLLAAPLHAEPATLRVMTFNVWYGGEQVSIEAVAAEIRAARADIVGLQEVDGNLTRIAALTGFAYVDERRRILSRFPIFDSGTGRRETAGVLPYSIVGLDPADVHAWVMVRPGKIVAVANTHLTSDPSGMEAAQAGKDAATVLKVEALRADEARALSALAALVKHGIPVFLTGDFNAPSHLDWTAAAAAAKRVPYPLAWPASRVIEGIGLRDSYREAHADPVAKPGFTWTPGTPYPILAKGEALGRIDFIFAGGPSRTLSSEIVGEPGGADVDIAVAPYPSDHRAVVSSFEVEPADAPALIAVVPRRVVAGDSLLIRTYAPSGRWSAHVARRGDATPLAGLQNTVSAHRNAVRLSSIGLAPGDYDAVLTATDGRRAASAAFTIVARDAQSAVELVQTPGRLTVRWRGAPAAARDWVGIYAAGDPDLAAYGAFAYTDASVDGETAMDITRLLPGEYEVRLFLDEGFEILAAARFTVAAGKH